MQLNLYNTRYLYDNILHIYGCVHRADREKDNYFIFCLFVFVVFFSHSSH